MSPDRKRRIGAQPYEPPSMVRDTTVMTRDVRVRRFLGETFTFVTTRPDREHTLAHRQDFSGLPALEKVQRIRALEASDPSYIQDSHREDYAAAAQGLGYFFEHVRERALPKFVLDIGTGTGNALAELAMEERTHEPERRLRFIGTALTKPTEFSEVHPVAPVIETQAESLEGIPDEAVGGIMSFTGIAFSDHPEMVAASMDRVLAPGGIIKATFRGKDSYGTEWDQKYDEWGYHPHDDFSVELFRLGYEIALLQPGTERDDILLAIKPGGQETQWSFLPTAMNLLEMDHQAFELEKTWKATQREVFGEERLAEAETDPATPEDAADLVTTVKAMCTQAPTLVHHGRYYRDLPRKDAPLTLVTNPEPITGFGDSAAERGQVSIGGFRVEERATESIYVDWGGQVLVRRSIAQTKSAIKQATTQEVTEAITTLQMAVQNESNS